MEIIKMVNPKLISKIYLRILMNKILKLSILANKEMMIRCLRNLIYRRLVGLEWQTV